MNRPQLEKKWEKITYAIKTGKIKATRVEASLDRLIEKIDASHELGFKDTSIEQMLLPANGVFMAPIRVKKALEGYCLYEVVTRTDQQLLLKPGFGEGSLRALKTLLAQRHLTTGMTLSPQLLEAISARLEVLKCQSPLPTE